MAPFAISLSLVVGFLLGSFRSNSIKYTDEVLVGELKEMMKEERTKYKIGEVIEYIDKYYVDNIGVDTLVEQFIPEIISKLDPHSSYIPSEEVKRSSERLEGSFDGVGIVFNMITDTLLVLEVIPGGPSSKVGVEMGDKIIKVDTVTVAGVKFNQFDVVKMLKGKGGTTVNLSIERKGFDELIEVPVIRGKVAINSLEAAMLIKPTVGYVKITSFSRTTHTEMVAAIDSLKKLGMESIILDLTSNSGGYLDQAILVANEFLPKGDVIVTAKVRDGKVLSNQLADGEGNYINEKLYLLINEFSASSSEIVAGAIQDNDRGTIVGRKSFGKGLIQRQVELSDGSMFNITIGKYYTPSGRCIQKTYGMGNSSDYRDDIGRRFEHNEFFSVDSIAVNDSLKYYTKSGKVVYGGGGIISDVFVPLDTTAMSEFMIKAVSGINIIKFATRYVTDNSKEILKLTSLDKVMEYLHRNENIIYDNYIKFLISDGIKFTKREAQKEKSELILRLNAYIGQYTPMGANAFYSIIYPKLDVTRVAVELAEEDSLKTK